MTSTESDTRFETMWDHGSLGALKAAARIVGETLIYVGLAIRRRTKTPSHKRLDYSFSPEAVSQASRTATISSTSQSLPVAPAAIAGVILSVL